MRRFFSSMGGRVFLILVCGVLASAALTLFLADRERQEMVQQVRGFHSAERFAQMAGMLDATPAADRPRAIAALRALGLSAELNSAQAVTHEEPNLTERLGERLGAGFQVAAGRAACLPTINPDTKKYPEVLCRAARVTLHDGTVLFLAFPQQPDRPTRQPHWWLFTAIFAALLGLLAFAVANMATRPLRRLAQAADALGSNIERPPMTEKGPTEVRDAAAAFNTMQEQIQQYIRERTQLLAAITHDLQTPLTRLRLRLEKVADPVLRLKLNGDLIAMQDMVRDGLDLARSMHSTETTQRLDVDSLLHSVCDDATDAGQDVNLQGETGASIRAQPSAIRRCLTNLIDNAIKYGGYARVSVNRGTEHVIVRVRDGGPGIPESALEKVFTPFFRLEQSRSRDTGGTGIGLSIARNIVDQHGGNLYLRNYPQGGVEAVLELPLC